MFPGGSLHTRQIRRNASEEVTSSPTPYRNVTTFPRQQRPKLFPDLHKGAVDGCLGRNAQFVDDEEKLPLCQYRFEQKKFSDPCGFRRHRSDLSFQAGGLVALFRLASFCRCHRIRDALLHSLVTRFAQRH